MKPRELKRWINRQRVLLAIEFHADDEGLLSAPSNRQLTQEAGIGPAAVKVALEDLQAAGMILIPESQATGLPRVLVFPEHPKAAKFLELRKRFGNRLISQDDWEMMGEILSNPPAHSAR